MKDCSSEHDIDKAKEKIENLKKERKKLIKLYTTELIDEKEFEEENKIYNEKIKKCEQEYQELVEARNIDAINEKKELLRKSFEKDIEFYLGIPDLLVDKILNKIEVEKLDDNGLASLEIILKIGIKINLLYKKKKIIKYIDKQSVAS